MIRAVHIRQISYADLTQMTLASAVADKFTTIHFI